LFQNPVGADQRSDETTSWKSGQMPAFPLSKVAVPKTEVLEQPQLISKSGTSGFQKTAIFSIFYGREDTYSVFSGFPICITKEMILKSGSPKGR
jgi:hypothetical protein